MTKLSNEEIISAWFHPRIDNQLLTAGEDGLVALWEIRNGDLQQIRTYQRTGEPIEFSMFSDDGQSIVAVTKSKKSPDLGYCHQRGHWFDSEPIFGEGGRKRLEASSYLSGDAAYRRHLHGAFRTEFFHQPLEPDLTEGADAKVSTLHVCTDYIRSE